MIKSIYATFSNLDLAELAAHEIKAKHLNSDNIVVTHRNKIKTSYGAMTNSNFSFSPIAIPAMQSSSLGPIAYGGNFVTFMGDYNDEDHWKHSSRQHIVLLTKADEKNSPIISSIFRQYGANHIQTS